MSNLETAVPLFFATFQRTDHDKACVSYSVKVSDYPSIPAARRALNEIIFLVVERLPKPRTRIEHIEFRSVHLRDEFTANRKLICDLYISSSPAIEIQEVTRLLDPYTNPPLEHSPPPLPALP